RELAGATSQGHALSVGARAYPKGGHRGEEQRNAPAPREIAEPGRGRGSRRRSPVESFSEVPVVVLGLDGLAHDIARAGAGEEVVVLVRVRGERGEDGRVHLGGLLREQALVA